MFPFSSSYSLHHRLTVTMNNSTTALFESYESDFKEIVRSIRGKLEGDTEDVRGEQRKAALRRVEMELDEADEMVRIFLPFSLLLLSRILPECSADTFVP